MMILMAAPLVTDIFFPLNLHILSLILIVMNIYQVTRYQRWFLTIRKDNNDTS